MSKIKEPTRDVFESRRRGISHQSVRRANERTVLRVVGFNSGASNAEISRLSGLAPQTVSAILVGLEKDGLITRGPVLRGRRGQPATPILLNENGGIAIGIEIGWRHLDVVLVNMHAKVLRHHHVDYAFPKAPDVIETITRIVSEFAAGLTPAQRDRLLDLGVAMPGHLADNLSLLGATPDGVEQWRELDLEGTLVTRTGLAVTILNDGNAGCWAELIALDPPRSANVIYLLVSHFIAAGIIGDGSLWEGPTGNAAELGSILVSHDGAPPRIAHLVASVHALRERLAEGKPAQASDLSLRAIADLEHWDGLDAWLVTAGQALAQVIFNATTVVEHPVVVVDTVLGRGISTRLVQEVRRQLSALPMRAWQEPQLVMGQLGHLAPSIGAAELPLFRRYF